MTESIFLRSLATSITHRRKIKLSPCCCLDIFHTTYRRLLSDLYRDHTTQAEIYNMRLRLSLFVIPMVLIFYNRLILTLSLAAPTSFNTSKNMTVGSNNPVPKTRPSSTIGVTTTAAINTGRSLQIATNATVANLDPNRCRTGPVPERPYITACCEYYYLVFAEGWGGGDLYLTTRLELLQRWNCGQFKSECEHPTYIFTAYTRRVYQRFCEPLKLQLDCLPSVRHVVYKYDFLQSDDANLSNWTTLIEWLQSNLMDWTDLSDPCIQVALFDRQDGGVGRFHEIIEPYVPYCGLQWNGFDYDTALNRFASPWITMSTGCRVGIVIGMVLMGVGSLITIYCNTVILIVFGTTKELHNSQATFKISLAIADVMIGVIVWPNMIVMQYLTFFTPRTMGSIVKTPYMYEGSRYPYDNPTLTYRYGGGAFVDIFDQDYIQLMGFFSTLGFTVSVYTLMIASFDRLLAISMPLKYGRHKATRFAKISCIILWLVSILIALLPIFVSELRYAALSSILISSTGTEALTQFLICLAVPLIITLIISVLTFLSSKEHARKRQQIMAPYQQNEVYERSLEKRLARTLTLMVGVFTLNVLMPICCTIAGLATTSANWSDPKNLDLTGANVYTTSEYLSVILLSTNSIWNFFIYNWRNKGFREAVKTLQKKTCNKPGIRHVKVAGLRFLSMARNAGRITAHTIRRYSSPFFSTTRSTKSASTDVTLSASRKLSSVNSIDILEKTCDDRHHMEQTSSKVNDNVGNLESGAIQN